MQHDTQALRYARQVILNEVGIEGQQSLQDSKVLVVGAGGLGCPVLMYLAGAGIGTLGIIDHDTVDISNLHRQVLYTAEDTGKLKATAAQQRLRQANSDINIIDYPMKLTPANVTALFSEYDIIVDATDNFKAKYLINDACLVFTKPLVFASISQFEGMVSVFNYRDPTTGERGPCFRDLFETPPPPSLTQSCSEAGVLGVIPGLLGCLQANEVLKIILGSGSVLSGTLLTVDCLDNHFSHLSIRKKARTSPTLDELTDDQLSEGLNDSITIESLDLGGAHEDKFCLVDVRESHERLEISLGGIHIPLRDLPNRLSDLNTSVPVVFYCTSGIRSKSAALTAKSLNPAATFLSLEGGLVKHFAQCAEQAKTADTPVKSNSTPTQSIEG